MGGKGNNYSSFSCELLVCIRASP